MNTFSSLTTWIILATIIPGFITIACFIVVFNWVFPCYTVEFSHLDNWSGFSIAVAIMIITQTIGVVKGMIIKNIFLKEFDGQEIKNGKLEKANIPAKEEYESLYTIISSFEEGDDKHGHIQRIIGQYFLSLNNLVAYFLSFFTVIGLLFIAPELKTGRIIFYLVMMIFLYILTFIALKERFKRMIQSLSTIRRIIANRNERESL